MSLKVKDLTWAEKTIYAPRWKKNLSFIAQVVIGTIVLYAMLFLAAYFG